MKKVLGWTLVALLAATVSFAQGTTGSENTLTSKVARKVSSQQVTKEGVLKQLEVVRQLVRNSTTKDTPAIMREVALLGNQFFAYTRADNPGIESLVREIETPITCKTRAFVVSSEIDSFVAKEPYEWGSQESLDELVQFSTVLKQYGSKIVFKKVLNQLKAFHKYVRQANEENMSVIMQSLLFLADTYFEIKDPDLADLVAREINREFHPGWNREETFKVSEYITENLHHVEGMWTDDAPVNKLGAFALELDY